MKTINTFLELPTEQKIKYIGFVIICIIGSALILDSIINPQPFQL